MLSSPTFASFSYLHFGLYATSQLSEYLTAIPDLVLARDFIVTACIAHVTNVRDVSLRCAETGSHQG
ncbi:hypothetical protein DMC63_13885 [Streptomyces sp. WAC 05977]|nr:hypothetical protein DMC63_13885 [Streptomyces sp. WAC 05977]